MPQPLEVDWSQVKTLALTIGVREAARQLGLTEDSVCQRSYREGWLRERDRSREESEHQLAAKRERQGIPSSPVSIPEVLKAFGQETRLSHAKLAKKIAGKLETVDEDELLMQIPAVLGAAKHASLTFGDWQSSAGTSMRLDLLAGVIDVRSGNAPDPDFDQIEIPD